jgi:CelD/BcsL family acetyltransferase involved in cellulose biosynthesis
MRRRNWRARGAGSEFDDPANTAFIEHLVASLPRDLLHCSQVRLDGRPLSSALYFRRGRELLFYKGAFDPDYARCSPGMAHFAMAAEWAISNGFDALDFMQGEEPYKFQWADTAAETASHLIAPLSGWPVWAWNAKARKLIVEYKV